MVMWFNHMIALIITFNNILVSLLISLIYHLFLLDNIPNILNLIYLLLKISFFLLYYWNILAHYCIVKKYINILFYYNFDFY